eukprot:8691551-Karenia_brevis.AAC.1
MQFLNVHLKALKSQRIPGELLFKTPMTLYRQRFNKALKSLGLPLVSLYTLRHSGPSADILHKRRSEQEVKSRGGWVAWSSMKRYQKGPKTQSLTAHYGINLMSHLQRCRVMIPQILKRNVVPLTFFPDP